MSFLVGQIEREASQQPNNIVLRFFFRNGSQESPTAMVATLIDQLIQQNQTAAYVNALHENRQKSGQATCTNLDQLWTLFQYLVQGYTGTIYILIDALDECAGDFRPMLLKFIKNTNWLGSSVRLAITTRAEHDIKNIVGSSDGRIDLAEWEEIDQDITLYIEKSLKSGKYSILQPHKAEILDVLPRKAKRMFRYAALALNELCENHDFTMEVVDVLSLIPSGLNGIYVWILLRLDARCISVRRKILTWVAYAQRPLSVEEIGLACATPDRACGDFDPSKHVLLSREVILKICGPLIEINTAGTLQFSHFSVKEFLFNFNHDAQELDGLSNRRQVTQCLLSDNAMGHLTIARTCGKSQVPI